MAIKPQWYRPKPLKTERADDIPSNNSPHMATLMDREVLVEREGLPRGAASPGVSLEGNSPMNKTRHGVLRDYTHQKYI